MTKFPEKSAKQELRKSKQNFCLYFVCRLQDDGTVRPWKKVVTLNLITLGIVVVAIVNSNCIHVYIYLQ